MSEAPLNAEHSPIVKLVGLVEAVRLLEERISDCVAECHEEGCGATAVARVLGIHRATVYRLLASRERFEKKALRPIVREFGPCGRGSRKASEQSVLPAGTRCHSHGGGSSESVEAGE